MGHYILVDANSVGYTNHCSASLSYMGKPVQAIYGFINTMLMLRQQYPSGKIIVLWDNRAHWRYEMLPEYKSSRHSKAKPEQVAMREAYKAQIPDIKEALRLMGVCQLSAHDYEADDLAGWLSQRYSHSGHTVTLFTGDYDWIQLVNENVTWRSVGREEKVIRLANFEKMTGFKSTRQFLDAKAMIGDKSDCIDGLKGLGKVRVGKILEEFGTAEHWYQTAFAGMYEPKTKTFADACSREGYELYKRNICLMSLIDIKAPPKESVTLVSEPYDEEGLTEFFASHGFVSLVRDIATFNHNFRKNHD